VIISFILLTYMFDKVLILGEEIRCLSLLGLKYNRKCYRGWWDPLPPEKVNQEYETNPVRFLLKTFLLSKLFLINSLLILVKLCDIHTQICCYKINHYCGFQENLQRLQLLTTHIGTSFHMKSLRKANQLIL